MVKRPTRLQFTEDDLSSDAVKKAAGKADKAATKAEKAVDRLTPKKHRKLRQESDISADRTKKLRFDKAKSEEIPPKPSGIKRVAARAPEDTLSAAAHKSISKYEDDNVGVQAAHQTELGAETAYNVASHAAYSHKLKAYDKAEKLVEKSDKANINALFEKFKKENPDASSNPVSRWRQKHNIKKEYAAARAGKGGKATAKGVEKTAKGTKTVTQKIAVFAYPIKQCFFGYWHWHYCLWWYPECSLPALPCFRMVLRLSLVRPLLRKTRTFWGQMRIIRLWKMICGVRWIILNPPSGI